MGLFSVIVGGILGAWAASGSSGGGGGSSQDEKLRKERAKINAENKIKLAQLENEKVEMVKNAQLDIIEAQKQAAILVEEVKAKGFTVVAQSILVMQDRMNELSARRLEIIEKCSMPIVQDIENFYAELGDKIHRDNEEYSAKKLPALLKTLDEFEEGSPSYNLFHERIQQDMNQQCYYMQLQMESVYRRQERVLQSVLDTKKQIVEQTGAIAETMLRDMLDKKAQLAAAVTADAAKQLPGSEETKQLPGSGDTKALAEGNSDKGEV